MTKNRKIMAILTLCLVLGAVSVLRIPAGAVTGGGLTNDSIKEKENQIKEAEKEKNKYKNSVTDLENVKKQLENAKSDLTVYVKELDSNLASIQANIADLKDQISVKEEQIRVTSEELDLTIKAEEGQYASMLVRIRLLYEQDENYIVESIVSAGSFKEMLNRADYMERIMNYDKNLFEEYKATREYVALCKETLEAEKAALDEAKAAVEAEEASLQALIVQKNNDIKAYQTDINNKDAAIREYEAMIKEQDEEIKALEAAIAEEKRALLAANGSVITYDGGMFKFPLAKYTRVSDDYGMRIHPTLGVQQFHNGVDFAAPYGTAIYAAYDGKVVAADYSSTMGNYVMIDHGSGLYTIYMHASSVSVSKGDVVVKGETIAAVGSTGRSTGNHLHFSVRLNGSYVSPWNYLSE
ncbi:MAG: peptidoglycan DD-metalloendopeptidase family protein [Acetatifactor sp.]|nr:peptidoglycan DD-metalloendopeptidase family protein [Acetatifactor sp.]